MNNVIFSDIECYMKGTDEKIGSNTCKISEHVPIAIGYSRHSKDEVLSKDEVYNRSTKWLCQSGNLLRRSAKWLCRSYFGPDCIKDYVRDLLEIETKHSIKINKAMLFTEEDKLYHDANDICHICNKKCVNKVRDHCHQTGRYRGPACSICNLNYKHQNFIPLIFHNGKGYDFNLLFNEIFKQNISRRRIDILPSTNGKARMFRVGILKFIDSYSLLTMYLDKIAKVYNMVKPGQSPIKNKTLYPYEYFKDENSYNNKLGNLSIQDFRSSLTTKLLTQDEVDDFNNSNSNKEGKELTLEYMESDIFILGHCFNLFVKLNMNTYKLNPLYYFSLPSYSFDCFLKLSKVELDTIQDEQILKDFISAMRGGICGVMGDRYIRSRSQSQSHRSIREPDSQIHEVVSPMAEHGEAGSRMDEVP